MLPASFGALAAIAGIRYASQTAPLILTPARKAQLARAVETARNARTDVDAWILTRCRIPLSFCASLDEFKDRAATFNADCQAEDHARAERATAAGFNR